MTAGPNPKFAPGAGMTPPVLAGREREKAVIIEALEDLGEGFNPTANIALIGPRGNGKTALLRWVEAHVDECEDKVKCAVLNGCIPFLGDGDGEAPLVESGATLCSPSNAASKTIAALGFLIGGFVARAVSP